jgi:hypothetical protein
MHSSALEKEVEPGSCEHRNEYLGSIKARNFLTL